ncbi:RNA 2'-phosphotransferase [Salinispora arenicola]|uniref:RNA 2'-phosphotransferase n=1 Tax=Salinispora arenicola TaxID=168697 RepID=UPI0009B8B869|nr:RNA 2'-phosphotransferase [Salinispora arenicola]MCN0181224.1 RNA 2'-phosphotransferase [Salinispora arenicola]
MDDLLTRLGKALAYVLRHRPDAVGLQLDSAGWVEIPALLSAMADAGHTIGEADLDRIVAGSDKKRYEVRAGRIRAAQGHSVRVELGLEPTIPPAVLYHGTVARFLEAIRREGLRPGERTHVHLSADASTARQVGERRGAPVVLEIEAKRMYADGHSFLLAANGVWLVAHVPPDYLALTDVS